METERKRAIAAELISDVPAERKEAFLAAVLMSKKSVKNTFPDLSDSDLGKICEAIARVVSGFNIVPVSELNNIITSMFTAYMVASAELEGAIEPHATPEHVKQIVDEALKHFNEEDAPEEDEDDMKQTGQYL